MSSHEAWHATGATKCCPLDCPLPAGQEVLCLRTLGREAPCRGSLDPWIGVGGSHGVVRATLQGTGQARLNCSVRSRVGGFPESSDGSSRGVCVAQKQGVAKHFNGSVGRKRQGKLSPSDRTDFKQ